MTHYVNSIEYRRGEDDIEYTYEEFQEFYGDKEGEVKWKEAGDKTIRLVFDEKKVKYKQIKTYKKLRKTLKKQEMWKYFLYATGAHGGGSGPVIMDQKLFPTRTNSKRFAIFFSR